MNQSSGKRMRGILPRLVGALLLVAVWPLAAHHGVSLYDGQTILELTGTVKEWSWANPHTWLYLNVGTAEGRTEQWTLEGGPPAPIERQGWSPNSLRAGETVTVTISPARRGPRVGILREVRRANGAVLTMRRPGLPD